MTEVSKSDVKIVITVAANLDIEEDGCTLSLLTRKKVMSSTVIKRGKGDNIVIVILLY